MPLPAAFAPIDFRRFHRDELPARLRDGLATTAGSAAAHLRGFAIRVGPDAYTYRPGSGGSRSWPATPTPRP